MRRSMAAFLVASLMAGAVAGVAGCNNGSPLGGSSSGGPSLGSVAIVDLDEIARRLGRDLEMNDVIEQQRIEFDKRLSALQQSLRKQYEDKKEKLGANPTDEEKEELNLFARQVDARFAQERQQANNELAQERVKLINIFREEVKPIAQQVAAERGLTVVLTKVDSLIYSCPPEAEITDAVVAHLVSAGGDHSGGTARAEHLEHVVDEVTEPPLMSTRPDEGDTIQE